jgi:succinyl-diaminopimelate desuccinylase
MKPSPLDRVNQIIEDNQEMMLQTLRRLIAVPSIATPQPEDGFPYGKPCAQALDLMLETAETMGFSVRNYDYHVGTADFGASDAAPALGILSHLDVVPVMPENWHSDPFILTEQDGCLFGRGVIDDKGPSVAALYALYAVKEAGIPLKQNVRLLMGCNEENGSTDIAYYLTQDQMPPMVFTPDGSYPVIHIEKGMLRLRFQKRISDPIKTLKAGTAPNAVPAVAEALLPSGGILSHGALPIAVTEDSEGCHVIYTGLAAHASTPETGDNAITGLLTALAAQDGFADCGAFVRLFPHGCTDGSGLGIAGADAESGALTCICSMMEITDGMMEGTVDIRYPVCFTKEALLEKVQARFAEAGFSCVPLIVSDPHCVPESSPFVQTLLSVYEAETGEKGHCIAIGGGTYVHDIPGGVAFGAEFPNWDYHMHGDDERMPIQHLMQVTRMIAAAIVRTCSKNLF